MEIWEAAPPELKIQGSSETLELEFSWLIKRKVNNQSKVIFRYF